VFFTCSIRLADVAGEEHLKELLWNTDQGKENGKFTAIYRK
jgi:hypothetical protein